MDYVNRANNKEGLQESIYPSYEIVKRNILFSWINIQEEYEKYKNLKLRSSKYPVTKLCSQIYTLYQALLRPKIKKMKIIKGSIDREKFIKKVDLQISENKTIPDEEIDKYMQDFAEVLEILGISDIGVEILDWNKRFRDSYGD